MEHNDERDRRIDALARDVLLLSRNTLLVHLRFLDAALSRFTFERSDDGHIATDGQVFRYNPRHVLLSYRDEREAPTRDYLHLVLHCAFRHAFVDPRLDRACWDLAADIAVECAIDSLSLPCVNAARQERQQPIVQRLAREGVLLTAEKIYRYFKNERCLDGTALQELRQAFFADDHDLWYQPVPESEGDAARDAADPDAPEADVDGDGGQTDPGRDADGADEDEAPEEGAQETPDEGGEQEDGDAPRDGSDETPDEDGEQEDGDAPRDGSGETPDADGEQEDGDAPEDGGETPDADGEQEDGGETPDADGEQEDGGETPDAEDAAEAGAQETPDVGDAPVSAGYAGEQGYGQPQPGGGSGADNGSRPPLTREELEELWSEIARHMQVDLDTGKQQRGSGAGAMMQNLRAVTRETYDYTDFLRRFAVPGEAMQINDDEFDYIYYTYGLQLYGNTPLIEPLEYKEVRRIREFVIAIDTSGSVKGDEVQRFIQKTYNILLEEESFFTKINLHIIQCDAAIQEVQKITSREEFDAYLAGMTLKGFGGTDFRPVFAYVDRMLAEREFVNLKGLIYFTDGQGVYPTQQPAYETAFVFVRDDYEVPKVPVWAIRLVLDRDDLQA